MKQGIESKTVKENHCSIKNRKKKILAFNMVIILFLKRSHSRDNEFFKILKLKNIVVYFNLDKECEEVEEDKK